MAWLRQWDWRAGERARRIQGQHGRGPRRRLMPLLAMAPPLLAVRLPHGPSAPGHLEGTLLPQGFFLGLGLIYLVALALDRLAGRLRLPAAAAILLLGLGLHDALASFAHLGPLHVGTADRISLALLIFTAGLGTDLRRIRGSVAAGLRLGSLGVLITLAITGLVLLAVAAPQADGLRSSWGAGLPLAAAWLTASCLTATDYGALEDLLKILKQRVSGRLSHLLQFEAALSTVTSLLCFSFIAGVFQAQQHSEHLSLHVDLASNTPTQLWMVLRHVLAGVAAGTLVGSLAPLLIDRLVRSESLLLLLAISLAFVAYGLGQTLGGGGLLAVFTAGVWLSNGRYRLQRFDQHALHRALHPFQTAAELTLLLLLGLSVAPADLITVLPLGLLLALALPLARLASVWLTLGGPKIAARDRLIVAGCGMRGAVPLGLALALVDELPHLHGISAEVAETLGSHLLAVIFLVVLIDLVLQSLLMQRLLPPRQPAAKAGPTGSQR